MLRQPKLGRDRQHPRRMPVHLSHPSTHPLTTFRIHIRPSHIPRDPYGQNVTVAGVPAILFE
jgi:hypothetical protein